MRQIRTKQVWRAKRLSNRLIDFALERAPIAAAEFGVTALEHIGQNLAIEITKKRER
jgi:hypothetical protein